jgi:ribosome-binding factor A
VSWNRKARIEALLKERIAVVLVERLNDPRLGFVTVTGVQLSGDRRLARVRFTVLGTPGQRRATARALADAAPHIQELIGPGLRMRLMPELRFEYDESIEKESRMLDLLDELAAERGEPGGEALDGLPEGEPAEQEPPRDEA